MVLYSIAWGNDLRIACIAVCTNGVILMNTEQPILWDYTVQAGTSNGPPSVGRFTALRRRDMIHCRYDDAPSA